MSSPEPGPPPRITGAAATRHDLAVINYRAGAAVLATLSAAACAGPGTAPAAVPAGCAATDVRWSAPAKEPRLTRVTLHQGPGDMAGRVVLDEPFTPSITGVTAPSDWLGALAGSLGEHIGTQIETGPAVLPDGGFSFGMEVADDPGILQTLMYEGAMTVSAGFTVSCTTPVTGVLTSWTTTEVGGLACGSSQRPEDPLGRLARVHCPATPAPRPSGYIDAVPFDEPSPF
jgi:hypothetical protein